MKQQNTEEFIVDSGARREFESGAVRDIVEGKGRCDLLPLVEVGRLVATAYYKREIYSPPGSKNSSDDKLDPSYLKDLICAMFSSISNFVYNGNYSSLNNAIYSFCKFESISVFQAMLEVSKHFEAGAKKYSERNWEKGIPLHSFIDSGVRHLLKHLDEQTDERHDLAFIWNILCAMYTYENHPKLIDLPFNETKN